MIASSTTRGPNKRVWSLSSLAIIKPSIHHHHLDQSLDQSQTAPTKRVNQRLYTLYSQEVRTPPWQIEKRYLCFSQLCELQLLIEVENIATLSQLSWAGSIVPQARYVGELPGSSCPVTILSKSCQNDTIRFETDGNINEVKIRGYYHLCFFPVAWLSPCAMNNSIDGVVWKMGSTTVSPAHPPWEISPGTVTSIVCACPCRECDRRFNYGTQFGKITTRPIPSHPARSPQSRLPLCLN